MWGILLWSLGALLANVQAFEDEKDCTAKNSYFLTDPEKTEKNISPSEEVQKLTECIGASMSQGSDTKPTEIGERNYIVCHRNKTDVTATPYRPCLTRKWAQEVAQALQDTAQCLDVPAGQLFFLLNHESHFLNVRSPTGAIGIGQLTGGNSSGYADKINELKNDSSPKCASLKAALNEAYGKTGFTHNHCNRLGIPGPGRLHAVFANVALYHKSNRAKAWELVREWNAKRNILWNGDEQSQLAQTIAFWSYNAGPNAMHKVVQSMEHAQTNIDLDTIPLKLSSLLYRRYSALIKNPSRKYEVAAYTANLERDRRITTENMTETAASSCTHNVEMIPGDWAPLLYDKYEAMKKAEEKKLTKKKK